MPAEQRALPSGALLKMVPGRPCAATNAAVPSVEAPSMTKPRQWSFIIRNRQLDSWKSSTPNSMKVSSLRMRSPSKAGPKATGIGGFSTTIFRPVRSRPRRKRAASPAARVVELHEMSMDNGVMRMHRDASYVIPEHDSADEADHGRRAHQSCAAQRRGQLVVDTELLPALQAIAQAALGQTVKALGAAGFHMRHRL